MRKSHTLVTALAGCCVLVLLGAVMPATASSTTPRMAEDAVLRSGTPAELLRNPTFQHQARGWRLSGRALEVSRSGRRASWAAVVQASGDRAAVLRNRRANSAVSAEPGDVLVATTWIRAAHAGATGQLALLGRRARLVTGRASTAFRLDDTKWHRVTASMRVSTFTSSVKVGLRVDNPRAAGAVYVDEVHLSNPAVTKLRSAGFNGLPAGRMAPSAFMRTLGGSNPNPQTYEDTFIARSHAQGKVLRTRLSRGTIISSPAGNNGIVVLAPLPRQVNQACISYQIRFDGRFDWSLGGKLPGLLGVAPGESPSVASGGNYPGDRGWSARLMWVGPKAYSWARPNNKAVSYMYGPTQRERYGDVLSWGTGFRRGTWHTVMQCHTMNHVGKADGVLRAWIDGKVVLSRSSYIYRTRSDVHISHLAWSIFRGGNTMDWAGSWDSHIDIDNVLITTR